MLTSYRTKPATAKIAETENPACDAALLLPVADGLLDDEDEPVPDAPAPVETVVEFGELVELPPVDATPFRCSWIKAIAGLTELCMYE